MFPFVKHSYKFALVQVLYDFFKYQSRKMSENQCKAFCKLQGRQMKLDLNNTFAALSLVNSKRVIDSAYRMFYLRNVS